MHKNMENSEYVRKYEADDIKVQRGGISGEVLTLKSSIMEYEVEIKEEVERTYGEVTETCELMEQLQGDRDKLIQCLTGFELELM